MHEFTPLVDVQTANMFTNGSKISMVQFESFGEIIECNAFNASHDPTAVVKLADWNVGTKTYANNYTPKNECKTALYPKLMLSADDDAFNIIHYEAHVDFGFRYPTKTRVPPITDGKMWRVDPGDSFWANSFWANQRQYDSENGYWDETSDKLLYGLEAVGTSTCRVPRFYGFSERAGILAQPVLNSANQAWLADSNEPQRRRDAVDVRGITVNSDKGTDFSSVLIVGQQMINSDRAGGEIGNYTYGLTSDRVPSMEATLGFRGRPVLFNALSTETANKNLIQYQSSVAPYYNPHACFVRWSGGTQTSYNANKSSISKILYPLPRFDNSGNTFGDLFFEASERTYLDLNNTEELNLNSIDLQIVDINEKPVEDLVGQTLITLHIRQKGTKL